MRVLAIGLMCVGLVLSLSACGKRANIHPPEDYVQPENSF